jgi:hypothetical protein
MSVPPIIRLKRSAVPGKIPNTTNLSLGEFGINTYDGKVYIQQDQEEVGVGSTVIVVNPWSVGVGSDTYNTFFTVGNVGIGTTNPTDTLTVNGDANITGIVSASSFIGDGSGLTGIISGVEVRDEGVGIGTTFTSINFIGEGVTATASGNTANITFEQQVGPQGAQGVQGATGPQGAQGVQGGC